MKYDFDTPLDRRNTDSYKWKVKEGELPMWVADMDFVAAPEIIEAMSCRLDQGVFGYGTIPEKWHKAYMKWWRKRHHFEIEKRWLIFCTGVVPAISTCVRRLTAPNENVLVQTPVYNIFFNSIRNNGRNILTSPLVLRKVKTDGDDEILEYEMDFDDLEKKLVDPQTTLMLLCNPQNPSGRIWTKDELAKVGELCAKYNVTVLSDEIHCDITEPGTEYVPFASVSDVCRDNSVTCISASKAFNLAGLQSAAVMIPNNNLRHKVWRALNTDEVAEPNSFAITSTVAAFEQGGEWLDELRRYISDNRRLVKDYIERNVPDLKMIKGDATYLLWLDARRIVEKAKADKALEKQANGASAYGEFADTEFTGIAGITGKPRSLAAFIREKTGLYLSDGKEYGAEGFLRMNIACPQSYVKDGLERLKRGISLF